jgi:hypothetical protein
MHTDFDFKSLYQGFKVENHDITSWIHALTMEYFYDRN